MTDTVVVAGAGVAGLRFVQKFRSLAGREPVVMLGAEPYVPYDRPPLSKQVLRSERDLPALLTTEGLAALGVDLRMNVSALGLDLDRRLVCTDNGDVAFGRLVVATGAAPVMLPALPGTSLRTWDDAVTLRSELRPGAVLAILGAGLIGCEVAASAVRLGAEVHLIDRLPTPMARVVGPLLADDVIKLHEGNGVVLHLHTEVTAQPDGRLRLDDGEVLVPTIVLQAVGIRPRNAWLAGTGLDDPTGVPCDGAGRTAVQDVFAVGDVACRDGLRNEHWTGAVEQAERTAEVVAGHLPSEPAVPYWWSDQYDIKFQGLGDIRNTDEVRRFSWGNRQRPLVLYGEDGRLAGGVGMSAAGGLMRLRAAIAARASFDEVCTRFERTHPLPMS